MGALTVILPAYFTAILAQSRRGPATRRGRQQALPHRHRCVGVAVRGDPCALVSLALDPADALVAGLMSFLAALTAQLVVLPLIIQTAGRRAAARPGELVVQRLLMAAVTLAVFWPDTRLGVAFLVFPVLGWAAVRASRRETHVQLFLVCLTAYALTFIGRGPLAGTMRGVPDPLAPALVYLFVAAACYLIVPLTLTVERLFTMTGQATRSATTLERLLDSASGTVIVATDAVGRITHYNAGAEQLLGYTAEEVVGQNPVMFHTPEEIARHAQHFGVPADHVSVVLAMVEAGERRDWEFTHKDGSRG